MIDLEKELGVTEAQLRQALRLAEAHVSELELTLEKKDARIKGLVDLLDHYIKVVVEEMRQELEQKDTRIKELEASLPSLPDHDVHCTIKYQPMSWEDWYKYTNKTRPQED